MQTQIEEMAAGESVEEQRERLGELIGLDGPASADVLLSAIEDREYARNLILCKDAPPLREFLLDNPPRRVEDAAAEADPATEAGGPPEHSTRALIGSASKSFWAWTKSGFAIVDEEQYARRFDTCLECPHLIDPPRKRVYRALGATGEQEDRRVCELCGCVASRKARLPHETCPAPHDHLEGMNRWGEPLPATQ
jgi:hypothetical protein